MKLKGYRAPAIAGLVLVIGLGFWTRLEWRAMHDRHRAELRRFADGVFLTLDASHDAFRPRKFEKIDPRMTVRYLDCLGDLAGRERPDVQPVALVPDHVG